MFKLFYCLFILILPCQVAHAGLLEQYQQTDNMKDFRNPDTADLNAGESCPVIPGQWSYHQWHEKTKQTYPLKRGHPEIDRFSYKWVIDNKKRENTWWVGDKGKICSDNRPLIQAYTIDTKEAGTIQIAIELQGNAEHSCRLRVFHTTDNDLYRINAQETKQLFDSKTTKTNQFKHTLQVEAGNDLCVAFQGGAHWWIPRTLSITIKQITP
ncbi:MAG: hypothetical protein ACF8OB_14830 [Phycisphaeraceae bacterium JB051]